MPASGADPATPPTVVPAQPLIEGAEWALRGTPFPALTPRDVAVLAAWIVAGVLVSQRFFRWR